MFVPPIIERELRVALRKHEAVKSRFRSAAMGAGLVCLFLLFGWLSASRSSGKSMHQFLFFCGLYLAILRPATVSIGLFCEERRNQTLELLYLTGMGPAELFLSKLLSGVLLASSDLLALTPFLAIPFFSGGVSLNLFLATIGCLPTVLLFTVAICVLASVLCRDDGAAMTCAIILGAVVCLAEPVPYFLGTMVGGTAPFSSSWLCLSPAYGPYLVWGNFAGGSPRNFWLTTGFTVMWSLLALAAAAFCLNRNWRTEVERNTASGWLEKWESWVHGPKEWRERLRQTALANNPFQWLAEQDRRPAFLAWSFMGVVVAFWLLGWAAWPRHWASPVNLYLTALLLIIGISFIENYAAARAIAHERRESSLELLLTTPLRPEEMLEGQVAATRSQFRPIYWALFGLCGIMMLGGLLTRSWTTGALVSYWVIWGCALLVIYQMQKDLKCVSRSMWIGLNTGRPMQAVWHSHGQKQWGGKWYWFWMVYNMRNLWGGLIHAGKFPSGSGTEVVIVVLAGIIYFIVVAAHLAGSAPEPLARRFIGEIRLIARMPLPDPSDPRFKKWDLNDSPPMSVQVQTYPERMGAGGFIGRKLGRQWGRWQSRRWRG